ncbi:ribosomal L7Ae/L30e/S12e/Gadd45 family protein [Marinicrinis sediminis]|uniref:Ribosomal L7Ae/L30e/S12e/Gadd45 family protein n=1 Tax=Marinicrinis sediminis TaxID=1652465 RepID=A0ABW5REL7_9BACL
MSNDEVIREGNYKIGTKQTLKSVELGKAEHVYVAKDADPKLIHRAVSLCKKHGVKVVHVDTMKMLGKACGIEVGAAMAALEK